ncbi:hypothetical protein Tco_0196459 [Tanacetum coccineum]
MEDNHSSLTPEESAGLLTKNGETFRLGSSQDPDTTNQEKALKNQPGRNKGKRQISLLKRKHKKDPGSRQRKFQTSPPMTDTWWNKQLLLNSTERSKSCKQKQWTRPSKGEQKTGEAAGKDKPPSNP